MDLQAKRNASGGDLDSLEQVGQKEMVTVAVSGRSSSGVSELLMLLKKGGCNLLSCTEHCTANVIFLNQSSVLRMVRMVA